MSSLLAVYDGGVMPVGVNVDLIVGTKYWFVAQARGIWMGAVSRATGQGAPRLFKFIPETGQPFEIDGKHWQSIIVFSLAQGQNTGLTSLNVVMQAGGIFQSGLSGVIGQPFNATNGVRGQSLIRLLEYASPIGGSSSLNLTSLIAAAGADISGVLAVNEGDLLTLDWCITDDVAGTSPHLSSIQVKDPNTYMMLLALGGGNASGTKQVRVQGNGNVSVDMHNGDSVGHTFMVNIYRVVA